MTGIHTPILALLGGLAECVSVKAWGVSDGVLETGADEVDLGAIPRLRRRDSPERLTVTII